MCRRLFCLGFNLSLVWCVQVVLAYGAESDKDLGIPGEVCPLEVSCDGITCLDRLLHKLVDFGYLFLLGSHADA